MVEQSDSISEAFICIADIQDLSFNDLSKREVRSLIFHLLYLAEAFEYDNSVQFLVQNLSAALGVIIPEDSTTAQVAREIIENREQLDEHIKPLLHHWRFDRLGVSTKLILRFAIWELLNTDTVANIVANEAIELAKCYSEKDAYKFINGIIDEAAKRIGRPFDTKAEVAE